MIVGYFSPNQFLNDFYSNDFFLHKKFSKKYLYIILYKFIYLKRKGTISPKITRILTAELTHEWIWLQKQLGICCETKFEYHVFVHKYYYYYWENIKHVWENNMFLENVFFFGKKRLETYFEKLAPYRPR